MMSHDDDYDFRTMIIMMTFTDDVWAKKMLTSLEFS